MRLSNITPLATALVLLAAAPAFANGMPVPVAGSSPAGGSNTATNTTSSTSFGSPQTSGLNAVNPSRDRFGSVMSAAPASISDTLAGMQNEAARQWQTYQNINGFGAGAGAVGYLLGGHRGSDVGAAVDGLAMGTADLLRGGGPGRVVERGFEASQTADAITPPPARSRPLSDPDTIPAALRNFSGAMVAGEPGVAGAMIDATLGAGHAKAAGAPGMTGAMVPADGGIPVLGYSSRAAAALGVPRTIDPTITTDSKFGLGCAEPHCISQLRAAGVDPAGASSAAVSNRDLTPRAPCASGCGILLPSLGIRSWP